MKVLQEYRNPALHFSGGKDSLACLYLLRDQLDGITVYWSDTGDDFPETRAVVEHARAWIPNFRVVKTDVAQFRNQYGYPTDLMPANAHPIGVMHGTNSFALVNRFDCCAANIMLPMHQRMLDDGVDLVIRGTKLADYGRVPHDGDWGPYDIWLPIKDWTHAQVFAYLEAAGAPRSPLYDYPGAASAPECRGCTAWWEDGKARILAERHPEHYQQYRARLQAIAQTLTPHLADLYAELR